VPVDVTGQHRCKAWRNIAGADDVSRRRERVVCRPNRGTLDALVEAEEPDVGAHLGTSGAGNEVIEPAADVIPFRGNASDGDSNAPNFCDKCPWPVEDVNSRMLREPQVRDATPLMVPRHHVNRYAAIGDACEWLERLPHHAARRTRTVEYVAAVHDQVDITSERRLKRVGVVRKEVVTTSPSIDARVDRQVEAEVSVREQQDPDNGGHAEM
jgi:hypothetical protein